MKDKREEGSVFLCDGRGLILDTILDGLELNSGSPAPESLFDLADSQSQVKLSAFLAQVRDIGAALSWEINVRRQDHVTTLNFFGVSRNDALFILASEVPGGIFRMYDELLAIINQQAVLLRQAQKDCDSSREGGGEPLDEFMRLNNELVNAQRELTKKNHALVRQEENLRRIIRDNPDAQVVLDAEGQVIFHNPAAVALFSKAGEELLGRSLDLPSTVTGPAEIALSREEGRVLYAELRQNAVEWERQPATLCSLRDVTARKEAEALREDVERMARHDLKGPLNAVINLPGLVIEDAALTGEPADMLRMVQEAGFKMLEMINRSLDLLKMERGTYRLKPEMLDLATVVRRVFTDLSSRAAQAKVELLLYVEGAPAGEASSFHVQGEELLLYSMCSNLVLNAVEASPQNQRVSVLLFREGHDAVLRTHNRGAVPQAIRHRFFEKFATFGKKGGTGLGNYSVRLTAEAHGGSVAMQTSGREGTTVTVTLPQPRD